MQTILRVTWGQGMPEDPRPVTIRTGFWARFWCGLFGHDGFTLGRTIRVRQAAVVLFPGTYAPFVRHELTHVEQQYMHGVCTFLWRYFFGGQRQAFEAQAKSNETAAYLQWR